ncbi:hypothetical protein QBC43DRAFT_286048 [Cladorrhinum sp. PSN259]|nr:hypothetical protein QBC43DRAFT_286048 [Cladorrhinum sp. PSN259]
MSDCGGDVDWSSTAISKGVKAPGNKSQLRLRSGHLDNLKALCATAIRHGRPKRWIRLVHPLCLTSLAYSNKLGSTPPSFAGCLRQAWWLSTPQYYGVTVGRSSYRLRVVQRSSCVGSIVFDGTSGSAVSPVSRRHILERRNRITFLLWSLGVSGSFNSFPKDMWVVLRSTATWSLRRNVRLPPLAVATRAPPLTVLLHAHPGEEAERDWIPEPGVAVTAFISLSILHPASLNVRRVKQIPQGLFPVASTCYECLDIACLS